MNLDTDKQPKILRNPDGGTDLDPKNPNGIKPDNVVVLKSGGPDMVAQLLLKNMDDTIWYAWCVWQDRETAPHAVHEHLFDLRLLGWKAG